MVPRFSSEAPPFNIFCIQKQLFLYKCYCVTADSHLFICRDNTCGNLGIRCGNNSVCSSLAVCLVVYLKSEISEALAYSCSY